MESELFDKIKYKEQYDKKYNNNLLLLERFTEDVIKFKEEIAESNDILKLSKTEIIMKCKEKNLSIHNKSKEDLIKLLCREYHTKIDELFKILENNFSYPFTSNDANDKILSNRYWQLVEKIHNNPGIINQINKELKKF